MTKCNECLYYWAENDEPCARCHYEGPDRDAPCNWSEPAYRYTVYLFDEKHDLDRWNDVSHLIDAYPDDIVVEDNVYGVTFSHGEWY